MIKTGLLKSQNEKIRFVIILILQNVIDVTFSKVDVRGYVSTLIPKEGTVNERNIINETTVSNIRNSSMSQIE